MDLSQLSTEDLLAMKAGDLSKVSTPGLQAIKQMSAHTAAQASTDAWAKTVNPTDGMSTLDTLNAGIGKAFSDIGSGIGQRLGLVSRGDVQDSRQLDAPLMQTKAGVSGNLLGNLTVMAPTALVPGAGTVPAAMAMGGLVGLLQPSASGREDVTNTALGAAAGAGGQWLANAAGGAVARQATSNANVVAQNAQKTGAARAAADAGYVIPPEDVGQGGGLVTKVLSGIGGKIKTAQTASDRNQDVTNQLARRALGIAPDQPLTTDALAGVRQQAAATGYQPVRASGVVQPDQQFMQDLNQIAATQQGAGRSFPGLQNNGVTDMVNALRQPQFEASDAVDAIRVLRDQADAAFRSGDATVGRAARQASDAMEGMLERHLQAGGQPDALQAFTDARRQIAQTYSVQSGLNTTTGDVAANALAKQLQNGRPLTGDLRTIAEAAQAFPKATQALKEAPKSLSPLDMALAVIQRDPMGLLTLGARPVARSIMLARPMQQSALNAAATPQQPNALLRALSQEQLTLPASFAGTNALAAYLAQQQ